eukprot:5449329-Amphidinium_carterae.1
MACCSVITSSLKGSGQASTQSKLVEDTVEEILEVCVDNLDVCEHLPAYDEARVSQVFVDGLQSAIVSMVPPR